MTAGGFAVQLSAGVLAAVVVALLSYLALQPKPDFHGWRQVKASAMHWTGVSLGAALTTLFTYILLFVGSSRADAERQMTILFWLMVSFGLLTVIVGWAMAATTALALRWRGETIVYRGKNGPEERSFGDVNQIETCLWGRTTVWMKDRSTILIDPNATGASAFIDAVAIHLDARSGVSQRGDREPDEV